MSKALRFLVSLVFLCLSTGAFASVVEPNADKILLGTDSARAAALPQENLFQFDLTAAAVFAPNAIEPYLVFKPHEDGSVSFRLEPLIIVSVPDQGAFDGFFLQNPGVLYYYNARFYDPTLGRFISEDPARSGGNWYEYGNDNPLRFVDPTGLEGMDFGAAMQGMKTLWNSMVGGAKTNPMDLSPKAEFNRAQSKEATKVAGDITKVAAVGATVAVATPLLVAGAVPVVAAAAPVVANAAIAAGTATVAAGTATAAAISTGYLKAGMFYDSLDKMEGPLAEAGNFFVGFVKGGLKTDLKMPSIMAPLLDPNKPMTLQKELQAAGSMAYETASRTLKYLGVTH